MYVDKRPVQYQQDASALFARLGGTSATDSVLLESSDIESKKNTMCMAILSGAARVTCEGQKVTVTPLTPTGEKILDRLETQLPEHCTGRGVFEFTKPTQHDERKRLQASSTADVLRMLQLHADYQGSDLPFLAGGFSFDYLETFENLPSVEPGPNAYPDFQFLLAETILKVDHLTEEAYIEGISIDKDELEERLTNLAELSKDVTSEPVNLTPTDGVLEAVAQVSDAEFREQTIKLQKDIYNGDVYQVVPARPFLIPCPDAFQAYRRLRVTNPSPYMFYIQGIAGGERYELIGASPESNMRYSAETREVQLYPIAGTRPRGLNPDGTINNELDVRAELDMCTDAKEISEHTMLVDLARNDLARVAVPATRRVAELLKVDRYSRVMHLVSRVTAQLDPEFDALDAYRACMNMGTLTGAPKLRAMELVREVEKTRRGIYGGAIGYLSGDGSMDTCVVIRTAFIRDGVAVVQAGAGIVRDSKPQKEAEETIHKASAVLRAIALAQNKEVKVTR